MAYPDGMVTMTERLGLEAVTAQALTGRGLSELGDLHRALKAALIEVETALVSPIVRAAQDGMTYTELAVAAGYGSPTTITKIMREAGASPGRGRNQPLRRRAA